MRNFYSQDGEAEILTPEMCDIVQAAFAAAFIDFAKGPPSATGIHQSWDRNTCLRDTKTGMRSVRVAIANFVRRVLGFGNATVCLQTVMDQCYTDITDVQENQLFIHAPEVIQHIRSEGCVTDQFLDSIGVPKLPGDKHIDRDGLVPWRRHAYLLSHR